VATCAVVVALVATDYVSIPVGVTDGTSQPARALSTAEGEAARAGD
jgi:hypothetical protein